MVQSPQGRQWVLHRPIDPPPQDTAVVAAAQPRFPAKPCPPKRPLRQAAWGGPLLCVYCAQIPEACDCEEDDTLLPSPKFRPGGQESAESCSHWYDVWNEHDGGVVCQHRVQDDAAQRVVRLGAQTPPPLTDSTYPAVLARQKRPTGPRRTVSSPPLATTEVLSPLAEPP